MRRAGWLVEIWAVTTMLMLVVTAEVRGRRRKGSEGEVSGARSLQVSMLESVAYSSYAGQQVF